MFIARIVIAIMTTIICFFLIRWADDIDGIFLPLVIIFTFAYIISSIFISVFDASANTILQCYLIDLDIARQSNLDPTHVPPTLARFLGTQDYSQLPENDPDDPNRNLMS